MVSRPTGKPAEVVDYDSDESRIVSGTEVSAKASSRRGVQEQPASRKQERSSRDPPVQASSGNSRHASIATVGAAKVAAVPADPKSATKTTQSTTKASPTKAANKPIIHRADSARSTTRSATISGSTSTHTGCTDHNCRKPGCEGGRNPERRYTISSRASMPPPQHSYQPPYDYTMMPPPSAMSKQLTESASRPRPLSLYAPAGTPYSTGQPQPQAATAGYYPYQQHAYGQQHALYASTPSDPSQMYAPPTSAAAANTVPPSPSSPLVTTYPGFPGQTTKFSARTGNPAVPGLANSISMPPPPRYDHPSISARGTSRSRRANEPSTYHEDDTSTESDSSDDGHYQDRRNTRREVRRIGNDPTRSKSRHRQSREVIVEDTRRPAVRKSYTTSAVPMRRQSRRGASTRPDLASRAISDPYDNAHSSSENYNSDKAVVDRRSIDRRDAMISKHARRSSIASSYDTPPTSLSSDTRYEAIIEDRHGRRRVYLSRDEFDELAEQRKRQIQQEQLRNRDENERMQRERIERYQKEMAAGYERENLTADNIKQANRKSMSHVSARSQKSGASGSKVSRSGGLTIERNGTVLYLEDGIQEIALRADEEGGTRVVINSGTGRESSYHGSKASSSRVGRSRTSRQAPIREEDQYEKAL